MNSRNMKDCWGITISRKTKWTPAPRFNGNTSGKKQGSLWVDRSTRKAWATRVCRNYSKRSLHELQRSTTIIGCDREPAGPIGGDYETDGNAVDQHQRPVGDRQCGTGNDPAGDQRRDWLQSTIGQRRILCGRGRRAGVHPEGQSGKVVGDLPGTGGRKDQHPVRVWKRGRKGGNRSNRDEGFQPGKSLPGDPNVAGQLNGSPDPGNYWHCSRRRAGSQFVLSFDPATGGSR